MLVMSTILTHWFILGRGTNLKPPGWPAILSFSRIYCREPVVDSEDGCRVLSNGVLPIQPPSSIPSRQGAW